MPCHYFYAIFDAACHAIPLRACYADAIADAFIYDAIILRDERHYFDAAIIFAITAAYAIAAIFAALP